MHDLIERVVKKARLEPAKAEKALGIMLSLVQTQGNRQKVDELFAKLPGAETLAEIHRDGGMGGLMGLIGGGLMGGPLAAIPKLQAAGLTMDQIKKLGAETLHYARTKAGHDLVQQVAGSIPGLGGYV
ncbi:hypothetical protein BH10PSE7_BH10PSE7_24260 [soil metagenome]